MKNGEPIVDPLFNSGFVVSCFAFSYRGIVKDTGPWSCAYSSTSRGSDVDSGFEQMELTCAAGDAEVFLDARCNFRTKPKAGKVPGKKWKRGTLQTLNLRRKGDSASTMTVSLRCDVDTAFETP